MVTRELGRVGWSLVLVLLLGAVAQADFPYNGSFEQLDKGLPVGWDLSGTWLSLSPGGYQGTRALYLAGPVAQPGNRLVSQGYRLVQPGDTLSLSVAYTAAQGGAVVGLQPCDALGTPLPVAPLTCSLPEADAWSFVRRDFTLDAGSCPTGLASVRVILGVETKGHEVRYDSVRLQGPPDSLALAKLPPPTINAVARPNLLKNPAFARALDGTLPAWIALGGAALARGSLPDLGGLTLTAGADPAAWLSDAVPVDASLPYECSAPLPLAACTAAGSLSLAVRLRNPLHSQEILFHTASTLGETAGDYLNVRLPRLFAEPSRGLAEVAVAMAPGSGQSVTISEVALRPEPVTLFIRPVAMAGDFTKPNDVTLFISATNNTRQVLKPMAYMKVMEGPEQAAYEPRRIQIGSQSSAYFPFKPQLKHHGNYHMLVRLIEDGKDLGSATFDFRVVEG